MEFIPWNSHYGSSNMEYNHGLPLLRATRVASAVEAASSGSRFKWEPLQVGAASSGSRFKWEPLQVGAPASYHDFLPPPNVTFVLFSSVYTSLNSFFTSVNLFFILFIVFRALPTTNSFSKIDTFIDKIVPLSLCHFGILN